MNTISGSSGSPAVRDSVSDFVAIFHSHEKAAEANRELQKSGFDIKKLSIVGKDHHTDEHVVGYFNAGDRMKYWGKLGEVLVAVDVITQP